MQCFVIMPFQPQFDAVYEMICRVVGEIQPHELIICERLDAVHAAGRITDDLLEHLKIADFCIADVSDLRPNVMWEVGFAAALQKPTILIARGSATLPFDIKDVRTIEYSPADLAATLKPHLDSAIRQTLSRYNLARNAQEHAQLRRAQQFWAPFMAGELNVLVGQHMEFAYEPSGFIGTGDTSAVVELQRHFNSLGLRTMNVVYPDRVTGDMLRSDLILLGGPDANSISREATQKINSTFQFGDPDSHVIALFDSTSRRVFKPSRDVNKERIYTDYAIIFMCANPFAKDKRLLLIAGSFGYGTWAGARFIASQQFIERVLAQGDMSVECLIETDVVQNSPQDIRVLDMRKLYY